MGLLYLENQDKKSKDRSILFPVFEAFSKEKVKLSVTIDIEGFNTFLNELLSTRVSQLFWNAIKEKFRKEVDEQELYKLFKFYILSVNFLILLDDAKNAVLSNSIDSWGYYLYSDKNLFDGKLDMATFRELLIKINKYDREEFAKIYEQNKDQKDEQPK